MFDARRNFAGIRHTTTMTFFIAAFIFSTAGTSLLCAADFSSYRGFQSGSSLSMAAKQTEMRLSEAKLINQRPPVIEELIPILVDYGIRVRPSAEMACRPNYGELAPVIGGWEESAYSYNLARTGDQSGFAIILYLKRVDPLALAAITKAAQLEAEDAPHREVERQSKRVQEARLRLENARLLNKPNFSSLERP